MTTLDWKDQRLGFRAVSRISRKPEDLSCLALLTAANISDAMGKLMTMNASIRPTFCSAGPLIGPATTVLVRAGDNTMLLKAIELAAPGDVLVIACQAESNNALLGGVIAEVARQQGVTGFVTNGMVRDLSQLMKVGLPVYARGVTPLAPLRGTPPGQVNGPISCGDVVVFPGDIVFGDEDGVVIIPASDVKPVAARAHTIVEKEARWIKETGPGYSPLLDDAHSALLSQGCEMPDYNRKGTPENLSRGEQRRKETQ